MAKVIFQKTIKYNGEKYAPNTIITCDEKDVEELLKDGGHKFEEKLEEIKEEKSTKNKKSE